jgi:hypothetical protein
MGCLCRLDLLSVTEGFELLIGDRIDFNFFLEPILLLELGKRLCSKW